MLKPLLSLLAIIGLIQTVQAQNFSLSQIDSCVQTIEPFYGKHHDLFYGTIYDNDDTSVIDLYKEYLKKYPKETYSSLYSTVLEKIHQYASDAHTHDLAIHVDSVKQLLLKQGKTLLNDKEHDDLYVSDPIIMERYRGEITDDAEYAAGKHFLYALCALQLKPRSFHGYFIDTNSLNRINVAYDLKKRSDRNIRNRRKEIMALVEAGDLVKNNSINVHHNPKEDIALQITELTEHIDTIISYQNYLDENSIDISELIELLRARVQQLQEAHSVLEKNGY